MKDVQCYELFGGIALKNHAFSFFSTFRSVTVYDSNRLSVIARYQSKYCTAFKNIPTVEVTLNKAYI